MEESHFLRSSVSIKFMCLNFSTILSRSYLTRPDTSVLVRLYTAVNLLYGDGLQCLEQILLLSSGMQALSLFRLDS